ncbi:uncharacterized protein LOC143846613 isoform X2 [Tasmannia lanceolata]|uniref:uncharacterized protein LOC143846613 isoform X2 n=1 Tax=Tasmannia lanceolata TaxID=3420 RepID=UPI0040647303
MLKHTLFHPFQVFLTFSGPIMCAQGDAQTGPNMCDQGNAQLSTLTLSLSLFSLPWHFLKEDPFINLLAVHHMEFSIPFKFSWRYLRTQYLEDMNMDDTSEAAAVELVAQGVIGKRVDEMESGFMLALDYMIQLAEKDNDDQRKSLLEVVKETVLSHLTKKCPPHVQVIGLLCRTPQKESRHELLRRVAAGGGAFASEKGTKVHLPGANLNDIANQADDLLETMEARPTVPDRKLLARLVLIREEARNMMGGGILDERNDRGLSTLPEAEARPGDQMVKQAKNEKEKKYILKRRDDKGKKKLYQGPRNSLPCMAISLAVCRSPHMLKTDVVLINGIQNFFESNESKSKKFFESVSESPREGSPLLSRLITLSKSPSTNPDPKKLERLLWEIRGLSFTKKEDFNCERLCNLPIVFRVKSKHFRLISVFNPNWTRKGPIGNALDVSKETTPACWTRVSNTGPIEAKHESIHFGK